MTKTLDPILAEQKSISTNGAEYDVVNLPKSVIEIVNANIQLVWIMGNYKKNVKPEDIIFNAQSIFKSGDTKSNDKFWKEHCAGSIRELVDGHFEANCLKFLKCVPKRDDSDEARQVCETIRSYKDFFNDFAHFKDSAIGHANALLDPENKSLKVISEESFDKLCSGFILHLGKYFKFKNK